MEVEHGLPRRRLRRVQEVHPIAAEPLAHPLRQSFRRGHDVRKVLIADLEEVARVVARDHERVSARPGVDVHERHRVVVLVHHLGGELTRHDLAEDAVLRHAPVYTSAGILPAS
jgi:hypothetical protein